MKIEKSNNPVGVGALVVVLVLIIGRILWMVFGHTGSVSAASTVSAPPPTATAAPDTQTPSVTASVPTLAAKPLDLAAIPKTTRNPFVAAVRPASAALRPEGPTPTGPVVAQRTVGGTETIPFAPLPPLPVRAAGIIPGGASRPGPISPGSGPLPTQTAASAKPAEAAPLLKLTAIVDGTEPTAIVQTANPQPVLLHVGDLLQGMRVTAIHEQEVVFARGTGFWTLPLQTAADCAPAAPISATPIPAAPESVISVATPKDNTDELH